MVTRLSPTILAKEVLLAINIGLSRSGKYMPKIQFARGTYTMPPPIPNKPDRIPDMAMAILINTPVVRKRRVSICLPEKKRVYRISLCLYMLVQQGMYVILSPSLLTILLRMWDVANQ